MSSLVLWEVSKKQGYIFSSNRLKENIGASIIVEKVVEDLPGTLNISYKDNLIYNGEEAAYISLKIRKKLKVSLKK